MPEPAHRTFSSMRATAPLKTVSSWYYRHKPESSPVESAVRPRQGAQSSRALVVSGRVGDGQVPSGCVVAAFLTAVCTALSFMLTTLRRALKPEKRWARRPLRRRGRLRPDVALRNGRRPVSGDSGAGCGHECLPRGPAVGRGRSRSARARSIYTGHRQTWPACAKRDRCRSNNDAIGHIAGRIQDQRRWAWLGVHSESEGGGSVPS